ARAGALHGRAPHCGGRLRGAERAPGDYPSPARVHPHQQGSEHCCLVLPGWRRSLDRAPTRPNPRRARHGRSVPAELVARRVLDELSRRDTSAPGQVMEFRVWTEVIQQSQGALHVFLPLLDRGLDAVVHRLTDGEYIPLQVKSKSSAGNRFVAIVIPASELVHARALIIAGLLTAEGLE